MLPTFLLLLLLGALASPVVARATSGTDYYNSGVAAAKQGRFAAAVSDFEQALLHGHNDPDSFYQLGLAFKGAHELDYAAWAVATALTDPVFNFTNAAATSELTAIEHSGGLDDGPPPLLRNVSMTAMQLPSTTAAQIASQELTTALGVLPTNAVSVSPEFQSQLDVNAQGTLTAEASSAATGSNTTVKFVFLGAVPTGFADLAACARYALQQLGLQQTVVVLMTPQQVAAATDRLDAATVARISASQLKALGTGDPAALAASVARAIVRQADDNDRNSTIRTIVIAGAIALAVLIGISLAIVRIAGSNAASRRTGAHARGRVIARAKYR